MGINAEEHEHRLIYCLTNFNWECNKCNNNYDKNNARYYCSKCNYNMCDKCREEKGYDIIKPFPKDIVPSNRNIQENIKESEHHEHQLVYCRTVRTCLSIGWICNVCKKDFNHDIWSFYCTSCDFDQCCECFGIN